MKRQTYIPFFDVLSKESKVWVFEDGLKPIMVTRQQAMKKVMQVVFFRSSGQIKDIKLNGQKTVTANWYTTKYFQEILQEMNVREHICFTMRVHVLIQEGLQSNFLK